MSSNKLFATFSAIDSLEKTLKDIMQENTIMYGKIFILESNSDELILTYNIEPGNTSRILPNTISVHRKKEVNCLYSINALNALIKSLNEGQLDLNYKVDWSKYKNSILLTTSNELRILPTKIHKIIYVD